MSVSLEIAPFADCIQMVGRPDRSSAYSLAGHISISLRSATTYFDKTRRPARLLLQSLSLTFEGQSELLLPSTGYSPYRLCAETHDVTPAGGPFEFSNEGNEDSDEPCTWNVVFSIPIPGWLPSTSSFGDELNGGQAGISYGLYSSAKFTIIEDVAPTRSFFSFANLCSAFTSRSRTVNAPRREITVSRLIDAPVESSSGSSVFNRVTYSTAAESHVPLEERDDTFIPLEILKKLRVSVQLPEHISLDDEQAIPIAVKMAVEAMPEEECSRFRITGFTADVQQIEKYRTSCSSMYSTAFPVPPRAEQAGRVPLRNPHALSTLYDMSSCVHGEPQGRSTLRLFSVLSPESSGDFQLAGNHYVFTRDANPALSSATDLSTRAFCVDAKLPFVKSAINDKARALECERLGWTSSHDLRPTSETPHFSVRHHLRLSVECSWDIETSAPEGAEPTRVSERLDFTVPLSFVNVRRIPLSVPASPDQLVAYVSPIGLPSFSQLDLALPSPSMPYADFKTLANSALPPYSQLFYSNGDRKIEYDLPQYEPLPATDEILIF